MSALRSSVGPAVEMNAAPSSSATMRARLVLPRPGRAGQQDVIERVAARGRGGDRDAELLLELVLPDELLEPPRAERRVEVVLGALVRRLHALDARRADHQRRATFSACAMSCSGDSPSAPPSSSSASWGE